MKKAMLVLLTAATLAGCDNSADVVSRNLSTQAANFEVPRRIVFYNVRTGDYLLSIEGLCAREGDKEIAITCQTGPGQYKKHFLGTTTEVTYFIEQTDPVPSDRYHYRVTFKPSVIVPSVNLQ